MEHSFLVAAIVLVSFIALGQPKILKGQSYKGHGHSQLGRGHSQMRRGHSQMRHGHIPKGYGYGYQLCYPIAERGDPCDADKQCAWNRRECPDYAGCHLICTNNPYKWCYGLAMKDLCTETLYTKCSPDVAGELICLDLCEICGFCGG